MSRRNKIRIIVYLVCSLIAGFAFWALGTNQGARWAVGTLLRALPLKAEVGEVRGVLAGKMELVGIHFRGKEWDVGIGRITWGWHSLAILGGNVALKEVLLQDISLTDKHPEIRRPVDLSWPKPPRFLSWFSGSTDSLRIKGLTYRSGKEERRLIDSLRTRVSWFFGDLSFKDLLVETPIVKAEGNVQTGFKAPFFFAGLKVTPKEPAAGLDSASVDINVKAARNEGRMYGPFHLTCAAGREEKLNVGGKVDVTSHELRFSDLRAEGKGRRGKLLGKGGIDFSSVEPQLNLQVDVSGIDLSRELWTGAAVSGGVDFTSDFRNYEGKFNLANHGVSWKQLSVAGTFEGDQREVKSLAINGRLLNGTLKGTLKAAWHEGIELSGSLQARELNPAVFTPDWQGLINADLKGSLRWSKAKPLEGTVHAELLNSVLRKKAIFGRIDARWSKSMLDLAQFDLHGNGFDLSARGILQERLAYQIGVSDLSGLIPGSTGRLMADGWVKWHEGKLNGALKGTGSGISAFGGRIGQITMETSINSSGTDSLRGTIKAKELGYRGLKVGSAEVTAEGTVSKHNIRAQFIWPGSGVNASFHGGYSGGGWQGAIIELTGNDVDFGAFKLSNPSELRVSADQLVIRNMAFSGGSREKLDFSADLRLDPMRGSIKGIWHELNLGRANALLAPQKISGRASGSASAEWLDNGLVRMKAGAAGEDVIVEGQSRMRIPWVEAKLDWNEKGLLATLGTSLGGAGKLEGQFHSEEPAHMSMPETGWFATTWSALDLGMVKAWLPPGVDAKGLVDGQANGRLLPGSVFQMAGKTRLTQGVLAWKSSGGVISTETREASLEIEWRDRVLKGDLSIALLNRGNLKASFQVPLPARLPVKFELDGPLKASASGEMAEKGLLTAMFPGLFGESRGQLQFDLGAGGTWRTPDFGGKIRLSDASAYLNQPGIRLQDVAAEAELKGDRITVSSFRVRSGSGIVRGSAEVTLGEGRVIRYEGKLLGEKFQAVYLPEVQVLANPDLSFEGTMERLALKGSINVPEALIRYEGKEGIVSSSSDVVIVDAREKRKKSFRTALDMQVNVILGDKVRIEALGLNARLEGKVLLKAQSFDMITAEGRIQTIKGQYKRRGISLDVARGSVVFAGRTVDLATLDILAVRKIHDPRRFNDIQAGVTVSGTLRSPLVKLYSEPAMADADVLSYMVLGKPLAEGTEGSQATLLMQAAGTILAKDQSSTVQSQVKRFVGVDTLDIQSGSQTTVGQQKTVPQIGGQQIGSSPLSSVQSTAGKTSTAAGGSAVASSIVTVGKYLSPELYVAFGRSLFSNDYLMTTRYSLPKHWELEGSRRGVESGVDLFYKIEFE